MLFKYFKKFMIFKLENKNKSYYSDSESDSNSVSELENHKSTYIQLSDESSDDLSDFTNNYKDKLFLHNKKNCTSIELSDSEYEYES